MILGYLGTDIAEDKLRVLLKTKSGGTSPVNVINIAEFGFKALLYSDFPEELHSSIKDSEPCIVFLWTDELDYWEKDYMHAVVVVAYENEKYYVLDPYFETSPFKIDKKNFINAWGASNYLMIKILPSD